MDDPREVFSDAIDAARRVDPSTVGHAILDGVGMVPVLGEVADLVNSAWYFAEGNNLDASLSAAGAIPFIGNAAIAAKWGKNIYNTVDTLGDGTRALPGGTTPRMLEAGPRRLELEAGPTTTHTLQQIRNMRQPEKWRAGEAYIRQLEGSPGPEHFPLAANPNGPFPVHGNGGRYTDAPVRTVRGIDAIEVKTYNSWTTVRGAPQQREVPLSDTIQQQINKDVALRTQNPAYQPRWTFLDAPPSAQLQNALNQAGIVGNIWR